MSWRGIFAGSLALIALQAVLSTDNSANRVGSGLTWIADLVRSALDPSIPAIPDLSGVSYGGGGWDLGEILPDPGGPTPSPGGGGSSW